MVVPLPPTPTSARKRRVDLLPPQELARLGGVELVARGVVEGFLQGLHTSPHRGFSATFADHRSYQPGDDLRHLDWRMLGRSGRLFVKQFEEETNLRAYLLLDLSASMGWSSRPGNLPGKDWFARQLAAALALLLLRQGDSVGLITFQERILDRLAARGGSTQWPELIRRLEAQRAGGDTHAAPAIRDVALRLRRKGLVILLSDLVVEPEETLRALRFLRHRGHHVLVFQVLDPGELDLAGGGETLLRDPESGEELRVRVQDHREAYRQAMEGSIQEWHRELRKSGMDHHLVLSDAPFSSALRSCLSKRSRLS